MRLALSSPTSGAHIFLLNPSLLRWPPSVFALARVARAIPFRALES